MKRDGYGGRSGMWEVRVRLFDVIVPSTCSLCGAWVPGGCGGVCRSCFGRMPRIEMPVCDICGNELVSAIGRCMGCRELHTEVNEGEDSVLRCRGVFVYNETVAAAMARFKAHGDIRLAKWVASELDLLCKGQWPGAVVAPIPGSPRNVRRRGWDHMEEVARELRRRGVATTRLLRRVDGPEQKALNRESRRNAVTRSLVLRRMAHDGGARSGGAGGAGSGGAPRRIVLIDDVRTTGATVEAAAALLRDGGYVVAGAAMLAIR